MASPRVGVGALDEALIPPIDALPVYARRGDFGRVGSAFVEAAAQRGLEPDHRVLDLGCGVGRFAVAFAAFAGERASYEGLDASPDSIDTCNTYISPHLERFRFQVVDVFNSHYRRDADATGSSYRFPFPDGSFDFVFSNSLFTHLTRGDMEHYLSEIGRVLDSNGRTFNTFFLLNAVAHAGLEAGEARIELPHATADGLARVKRLDRPEAIIAYEEDLVRTAHAEAGLRIEEPVRYGTWSGRESSGPGFGNKDIVVAVRD